MVAMLVELEPTFLDFDQSGTPYSPLFKDVYFDRQNGLEESHYVFLQGNQLPARWQQQDSFVIAETGFGTGLNFLATWQAWRNDPQRCKRLHYLSIEKYPLSKAQLQKLHQHWPDLQTYSETLLNAYPPRLAGLHTLLLEKGQLRLSLYFYPVETALQQMLCQVNAWYLDGFAPSRNQAMWSASTLHGIAKLCAPNATLSTFTAASQVRHHLQAAGFQVEKRKGFGHKREMITARLLPAPQNTASCAPWFALPKPKFQTKTATVIGGGIAGCQIAYALAKRGWQVTLLERREQLAMEASGNRAGVLTPKMTAEPDWGERFYRQAFLFALRQLHELEAAGKKIAWQACGALQLNHNDREHKRWQALQQRGLPPDFIQGLDQTAASQIAGINLPQGGSFFPAGGWLHPASLCMALCEHKAIQIKLYHSAWQLKPMATGWRILNAAGDLLSESAIAIIANGSMTYQLGAHEHLPLIPVRGQTSLASASEYSQALKVTLGHEGYFTPAIQGNHIFGASFERQQTDCQLNPSTDQNNWQQLHKHLPHLADSLGQINSGHCALRITTPDRYPCVGAVPDFAAWRQDYVAIRHGQRGRTWPEASYQAGLFINTAYGSRGLSTAALCSDMLASIIHGEPLPLEKSLYQKLHPGRFLLRNLQQNRS